MSKPAPAFGGAAAGSLLAIAAAQLIRSSLYTSEPLDLVVFTGLIGLLFGVANYSVPATGVARLARTTSDGSTQQVMSPGADKHTGRPGVALSLATPQKRFLVRWRVTGLAGN